MSVRFGMIQASSSGSCPSIKTWTCKTLRLVRSQRPGTHAPTHPRTLPPPAELCSFRVLKLPGALHSRVCIPNPCTVGAHLQGVTSNEQSYLSRCKQSLEAMPLSDGVIRQRPKHQTRCPIQMPNPLSTRAAHVQAPALINLVGPSCQCSALLEAPSWCTMAPLG